MNIFEPSLLFWCTFFCVISWVITFLSLPVIINISLEKNLMAVFSERSSHEKKTPTLGGVGIFMGFILTFSIYGTVFNNVKAYALLGTVTVLFFLGLKDDLMVLSAKKKFIVQLLMSLLLILSSNLTIKSFYGFLGIYELNSIWSIGITTFVFLLLINAYNLIDGIDGLASIIAICFLSASTFIFYHANIITTSIISTIVLGPIIAFLQFNFSKKKKIFMGDTGSMIVGFLISFLAISLLNVKGFTFENQYYFINPTLLISLLFYPLLDTTRVFFIRIFIYKKSPFSADKNHIHHHLLKLGFKHWQISMFVGILTIILTIISVLINHLDINFQVLIITIVGLFIFTIPITFNKMTSINFSFFKNSALLLLLSLFLLFQSCTTKKDLLYFQTPQNKIEDVKIIKQHIEVNDILNISINSIDAESSRLYNIELLSNNAGVNGIDIIKLKSYLVNDQGIINLPVLGAIGVLDKTTDELELFLTKLLLTDSHLKDPIVRVRILNSKVTVLGEVRNPGTFTFTEKNITLLQAIGLAGDLNINGKRTDVLLIRQENNIKTINHIDLTLTDWMGTDLYYIKQNDVIVVNPNSAKIKSAGIIGNTGALISVVSLLLTGLLLIKN